MRLCLIVTQCRRGYNTRCWSTVAGRVKKKVCLIKEHFQEIMSALLSRCHFYNNLINAAVESIAATQLIDKWNWNCMLDNLWTRRGCAWANCERTESRSRVNKCVTCQNTSYLRRLNNVMHFRFLKRRCAESKVFLVSRASINHAANVTINMNQISTIDSSCISLVCAFDAFVPSSHVIVQLLVFSMFPISFILAPIVCDALFIRQCNTIILTVMATSPINRTTRKIRSGYQSVDFPRNCPLVEFDQPYLNLIRSQISTLTLT